MSKLAIAVAAATMIVAASSAKADVISLSETFASGAVFNGTVTFDSAYDELTAASGVLSGGGYGNIAFDWTWDQYNAGPRNDTGITGAHNDWILDGTPPSTYSNYIGISWEYSPTLGLNILLPPAVDPYYGGIDAVDAAVTADVNNAVPEPASMALFGTALVGFGLMRRRKRA